jgi:hypothetical protein
MKKVFLLSFLLVLLCVSPPATALDISVGGKGGIAHSGYMGSDHKDFLSSFNQKNALALRLVLGAFVTFSVMDYLQIQPEILVLGSGGKTVDSTDPDSEYFIEKFTYLNIPVLIKGVFNLFTGSFFVFAGPGIRILLGDGSEAGSWVTGPIEVTYGLDLSTVGFSGTAGAGYSFSLLGGDVSVEIRYFQGISKMNDQDLDPGDHRTWSIALIGGYAYRLKK